MSPVSCMSAELSKATQYFKSCSCCWQNQAGFIMSHICNFNQLLTANELIGSIEDKSLLMAVQASFLSGLAPCKIPEQTCYMQGPYVLVMLTTGKTGTSYLKGAWLIAAYRSLSRPFRKNVKYILLVKPSNGIRALLLLFKPFVSKKAHSKLKRVASFFRLSCGC